MSFFSPTSKRSKGLFAHIFGSSREKTAMKYLKKNGFKVIEKNYLCKSGEIDIIASKENCLYFIEVKASDEYDTIEMLRAAKKKRLIKSIELYLLKHPQYQDMDLALHLLTVANGKCELVEDILA